MKKKKQNLSQVKFNNFLKNNKLLIGFILFIVVIGAIMVLTNSQEKENLVYGDDVIDMYFFHLSTCPHCHAQIKFHKEIFSQYPNVRLVEYEITEPGAREKYAEMAAKFEGQLDPTRISTPTTIIGNRTNVGYGSDLTSGQILLDMIAEEQARIDANWDENSMIRTLELRAQLVQE